MTPFLWHPRSHMPPIHRPAPRPRALSLVTVGLLAACGAGERQAPATDALVIERAPDNNGDRQVGIAGRPLDQDFRALVTRDSVPVEGVTVYWTTRQGSIAPTIAPTGPDGISAARWTTKVLYTQQEAYAGLHPDPGPRVPGSVFPDQIQFTAIATPDPVAANTVHVLTNGGNRFEPASITVMVGDTVNWLWPEGPTAHNIVPDDGDQPPTSGAPTIYPKFLSFRFVTPGVYRYHCAVHGGAGGAGMSGSVTVVMPSPNN